MIAPFAGTAPRIDAGAWVAPNATIVGDVTIGPESSIWFGAVVRGDVFPIRIGRGTNVQDNSVIHVTTGKYATQLGNFVTVGHSVTLHGCTVHDFALIGIGAVVLDEAEIGEEAMVGAGALVTPGTVIPPRMLALGSPARAVRPLKDAELEYLRYAGSHYVDLWRQYRAGGIG